MRILVCFKMTPDMDKVLPQDWKPNLKHQDLAYAGKVINCFDESALEIALRLGAEKGADTECIAITLGEMPPSSVVQTLYAVGFSKVLVINTGSSETDFMPEKVAQALAETIAPLKPDLVFTGIQSPLADTGEIPYLVAEQLHFPMVSHVETAALHPQGISAVQQTPKGRFQLVVKLPALLSVGNSPVAALRMATLRARLAQGKKQAEQVAAPQDLQAPEVCLEAIQSNRICRFVEILSSKQAASELLREVEP